MRKKQKVKKLLKRVRFEGKKPKQRKSKGWACTSCGRWLSDSWMEMWENGGGPRRYTCQCGGTYQKVGVGENL